MALFELEPWLKKDITSFQNCYQIVDPPTRINVDGGAGTGPGSNEAALDIETVTALAPKARVLVYEAPPSNYAASTIAEYTQIIDDDRAQVLSSSWGYCESYIQGLEPGLIQSENTLFEQAAMEGISVFVAAGDTGSDGCLRAPNGQPGLAVLDPAAQPFVTGVGGTELTGLGPPPTEQVWNDRATPPTGAGGGGISSEWPMPSWQKDPGVINQYSSGAPCQATSGYCREVPDVSASADYQDHGYIELWSQGWMMNGGTSAAAPLWAGIIADIESQASPAAREGFLNPRLYSAPARTFNDVVIPGNNDYTNTHGGQYPITDGYDMATGLGSPNASKLNQALKRWAAIEAPLPADEQPRQNFTQRLKSVTCPSSCDAIGEYTGTQSACCGLLLTGSGLSWAPTELRDEDLSGEACPSATACVVVAVAGPQSLLTGWGHSWAAQQVPLPPNAAPFPNTPSLDEVACPSLSECVAAGHYIDTAGHAQGLLVTGSGDSWTSTEAPLPPNTASNPEANLANEPGTIACSSPTSCVVTGEYTDTSGREEGLLLTGSGTSWTPTEIHLPAHAGAAANPHVSPTAVTCQSAVSCTVTGVYTGPGGPGDFRGFLLTGAGTSWTAIKPPLPANASKSPVVWLTNAACPSTAACTVAGFYTNASGNQEGLVLNGEGTSWTPLQTPWPSKGDNMQYLGPITCSSPTACLIVGQYTDSSNLPQGLLLTGSGSSWKATKAPLPANVSTSAARWVQLNSAACQSAAACVAVGQYTDKAGYFEPLILAGSIR